MRSIIVTTIALGLLALPSSTHAAPEAAQVKAKEASPKERILGALELPLQAQALRKAGVEEAEVAKALQSAKKSKLEAKATAELLREAAVATKEHGHVEGLGGFVQAKLDEGLRGQDLAAAIRQEHQARGKKGPGKPDDKGKPEDAGKPDDKGKPEDAGKPDDKGKPEDAGKPDDKGKPEDAGKPDDAGKPEDAGKPDDKGKPEDAGKPDDKGKPQDAGKPDDKGKPEDAGKPDDKGKPADKGKPGK